MQHFSWKILAARRARRTNGPESGKETKRRDAEGAKNRKDLGMRLAHCITSLRAGTILLNHEIQRSDIFRLTILLQIGR
jgi:hypothetical protein